MKIQTIFCIFAIAAWLAIIAPKPVVAVEPAEDGASAIANPQAEELSEKKDPGIGLNLDLGFSTHYVFRGINLFMKDEQLDPHTLLAPSVTWTVADTGLTLGWWAAFQLNGNVRENIDDGEGLEQDLFATYEYGLTESVALGFQIYGYFYPFAVDPYVWLEPGASITWSTAVDVKLAVTYMAGLQDATYEESYLYVSPSVCRSFELNEPLTLELEASLGYKAWFLADQMFADNTFDIGIKTGLAWAVSKTFYVTPAVGFAWTNLAGLSLGDEIIAFGALNVGADL